MVKIWKFVVEAPSVQQCTIEQATAGMIKAAWLLSARTSENVVDGCTGLIRWID